MINILTKIIKLNHLLVVGMNIIDNEETYNVLAVKKKGNSIDIVSMATYNSFDKLNVNLKLPVILVIDGKGVLNKEIDYSNEVDINWQKNIDYNTIYYTSVKGNRNSFISFCRKNVVDDIISKFSKQGFQVVEIYTGSFLGALLSSTIKTKSLMSNDLILEFENEKINYFRKRIETDNILSYIVDKKSISNQFLPLYGAVINYFVQPKEVQNTKKNNLNIDEFIYKKAFNFFGIYILIGFFSSLLVSFFLIRHYSSLNATLSLQNVYSNQSYEVILDLERQKEKKQIILKESGMLSSKYVSFYVYEIISKMPNDISLTLLDVMPLQDETKSNKKITFQVNTIIVKGETFKESSFNNWLENLKKMNWLQHFEIISLKKDKKNKSQFAIKITLKDV